MAHGVRRFTSSVFGVILADTVLRYIAPMFGINVSFTSDELIFIVVGAVFTALVADKVYKRSYQTLEERYENDSKVISR